MADLLVIADDLTGALDTGAQFARYGRRTLVAFHGNPHAPGGPAGWGGALPAADAGVWVLDTESRPLAPAEACTAVARAVAPYLPVPKVYKKVDSTLRGPIGAELEALLALGVAEQVILAPAFPAQGRTVRAGELWVQGVPLAQTPFARPGPAISSVSGLLALSTRLAVGSIGLEVVRQGAHALARALAERREPVLVLDALEDADLATAAQAVALVGRSFLLAGSAGWAAHLPGAWGWRPVELPPRKAGAGGALLCVAATRHPALAGQLLHLERQAHPLRVSDVLAGLLPGGETAVAQAAAAVASALAAGRDVVLTTLGASPVAGGEGRVAALLASIAAQAMAQARPGGLILTGGDTAVAVCRALGAQAIAVEGEVEPGAPLGRLAGGAADGAAIATKAGGFGDEAVLWRMACALRRPV